MAPIAGSSPIGEHSWVHAGKDVGLGNIRLYVLQDWGAYPNKASAEDAVVASFRSISENAAAGSSGNGEPTEEEEGPGGFLCFKVALKHHKAKRAAGANESNVPSLFICCHDADRFTDVLTFVAAHVDADAASSAFMTMDTAQGIPAKQSAENIFMKYGWEFELRTGIHLSGVAWHERG